MTAKNACLRCSHPSLSTNSVSSMSRCPVFLIDRIGISKWFAVNCFRSPLLSNFKRSQGEDSMHNLELKVSLVQILVDLF